MKDETNITKTTTTKRQMELNSGDIKDMLISMGYISPNDYDDCTIEFVTGSYAPTHDAIRVTDDSPILVTIESETVERTKE